MDASWNTMYKLVSSIHLILKPPLMFSQSEKATLISFVFSSFGKPVKQRIRVTAAERLFGVAMANICAVQCSQVYRA
jgi:hypothetical protein